MLKIPKISKYKKTFKGCLKNAVAKNYTLKTSVNYGTIGLKSVEFGRLTPNVINCCRQFLSKRLKKISQVHFPIFPHLPVTKKPLEVRMGKGKGAVDHWSCNVYSGTTLIEIAGSNMPKIERCLVFIQSKLPIKTRIIYANKF